MTTTTDHRRAPNSLHIAMIPLINAPHPDMALGIALWTRHQLDVFRALPNLHISEAHELHWDNAAHWLCESNMHTVSTTDMDAYTPLLDLSGTRDCRPYEEYMHPVHFAAFAEVWHTTGQRGDRRFKRLPVGRDMDQVKQALLEHQGARHLTDDDLPTPVKERKEVFRDAALPTLPEGAAAAITPVEGEAELDHDTFVKPESRDPISHDTTMSSEGRFEHHCEEAMPSDTTPALLAIEEQTPSGYPVLNELPLPPPPADTDTQPIYAKDPERNTALAQPLRSPFAPTVEDLPADLEHLERWRGAAPLIDEVA